MLLHIRSAAIHDKLLMAAHGEPGAPHLPDITIAYPKTALLLAEKGLLADLSSFSPLKSWRLISPNS